MLCCVSRKAAAAAAERDFGCPRSLLFPPDTCQIIAQSAKHLPKGKQLETCVEEEDVPPILLPCATCTRTFMPESLEKHKKICERTAIKKRKPFDSAKQRIQGTDLAEFLPKQEKRRSSQDDNFHRKAKSSWKDTHNEFIQAIRAARGDTVDSPSHRQNVPVVSTGAPTRAYEKGACPTCKRQFGIKSYDRHVEWCKDKATRVPLSPATNIAKERLEARMKYRAPVLKNRRAITREKYSPSGVGGGGGGSATSMGSSKTSPSSIKPKESSSFPICNRNNETPGKQKPAVPRRPAPNNREPLSSGPMKSRPADRGNRQIENSNTGSTSRSSPRRSCPSYPIVPPIKVPLSPRLNISSKAEESKTKSKIDFRNMRLKDYTGYLNTPLKSKRPIVSSRSLGHPKINDMSINNEAELIVKPYLFVKECKFVTWKALSDEKNRLEENKSNFEGQDVNFKNEEYKNEKKIVITSDKVTEKKVDNIENHNLLVKGNCNFVERLMKADKEESAIDPEMERKDVNWRNVSNNILTNLQIPTSTLEGKKSEVENSDKTNFGKSGNNCNPTPNEETENNFNLTSVSWTNNIQKLDKSYIIRESKDSVYLSKSLFSLTQTEIVNNSHLDSRECNIAKSPIFDSKLNILDEKLRKSDFVDNETKRVSLVRNNSSLKIDEINKREANFSLASKLKGKEDSLENDFKGESETAQKKIKEQKSSLVDLEVREKMEILNEKLASLELNLNLEKQRISRKCKNIPCSSRSLGRKSPIFISQGTSMSRSEFGNQEFPEFLENMKKGKSSCGTEENFSADKAEIQLNTFSTQNLFTSTGNKITINPGNPDIKKSDSECGNLTGSKRTRIFSKEEIFSTNSSCKMDSEILKIGISDKTIVEIRKNIPNSKNSATPSDRDDGSAENLQTCIEDKFEIYQDIANPGNTASCKTNEKKLVHENLNPEKPLFCDDKFYKDDSYFENSGNSRVENTLVILNEAKNDTCLKEGKQVGALDSSSNSINFVKSKNEASEKRRGVSLMGKTCRPEHHECNNSLSEKPVEEDQNADRKKSIPRDLNKESLNFSEEMSKRSIDLFPDSCNPVGDNFNDDNFRLVYENYDNYNFDYDSDNNEEKKGIEYENKLHQLQSVKEKEQKTKKIEKILSDFVVKSEPSSNLDTNTAPILANVGRNSTFGNKNDTDENSLVGQCAKLKYKDRKKKWSISKSIDDKIFDHSDQSLRKASSKDINKKIRRMLRGSTDTLVSSMEAMDLNMTKPKSTLRSLETAEAIEQVIPLTEVRRKCGKEKPMLPEINGEFVSKSMEVARLENYSVTFWKQASETPMMDKREKFVSSVSKDPKAHLPPVFHSNPFLGKQSGNNKAYDPFAIADRQMIELFSDTSEQSSLDLTPEKKSTNSDTKTSPFPLSHSSAFVKYPKPTADKRTSLIAPPTEFDDLTSDFSSDSAETISRELFLKDTSDVDVNNDRKSKDHVFSRRVIIDKSAALGTDITDSGSEKNKKSVGKVSPKVVRPTFNRSNSVRSNSASSSITDRNSFASSIHSKKTNTSSCIEENLNNRNNNNYMSGSNLSLSSIVSSEIDIKRSNSVFDEFMSSFEDDNVSSNFPSLRSLLKNDSSFSSPPERQRNGQISDEDLSSSDSYKKSQDHGKLSADSAYSSLNRKYSNHGRSATDVANRHNEDVQLKQRENDKTPTIRCKMSKFCHECGSKFPETAKFCCECGVKRLTL